VHAAPLVKQKATAAAAAPQGVCSGATELVDPLSLAGRGPYLLPLGELAFWTFGHRRARAAAHDRQAARLEALGDAAWRAYGRAERPVSAALARPGREVDESLREGQGRRFFLQDGRINCTTHAERRRVRWERYRDRMGEARQKRVTSKVWVPAHEAHEAGRRWHESRGDGQRHRTQQVGACGVGVIEVSCAACGSTHETPTYCGIVRMCPGCNVRRSMKSRSRFARSLEVVLRQADRAGSFRVQRKGGTLGQKMMSLTVPHFVIPEREPVAGAWGLVALVRDNDRDFWRECGRKLTAAARVVALFVAWKVFVRALQKLLREPWKGERPETVGECWSRAFEWTPGEDGSGLGHPHFHLWCLLPWLPTHDEHRIESVAAGRRRPTTTCLAQHRVKGAWGWAETMRRERCSLCSGDARRKHAAGAWGWAARELRDAGHLDELELYFRRARQVTAARPLIERRRGLQTMWADALGAAGVVVRPSSVGLDIREAYAHPIHAFREVKKPNGVEYRKRYTRSVEIRDSAGGVMRYFEGFSVSLQDESVWETAGVAVIAGVAEALEGRRLSQASKVNLRRSTGETFRVGFYGIADSYYQGECGDCAEHKKKTRGAWGWAETTRRARKGEADLPQKFTRIHTWQSLAKARLASTRSSSSSSTGPALAAGAEARYRQLVNRLLAQERAGPELMARLAETCEAIRFAREGGRVRTRSTWSMRDRLRYAARLRR